MVSFAGEILSGRQQGENAVRKQRLPSQAQGDPCSSQADRENSCNKKRAGAARARKTRG
jgi:hypothetical protein